MWTAEEAHHVQLWGSLWLLFCVWLCLCVWLKACAGRKTHTLALLFSGATEAATININSSNLWTYTRRVKATRQAGKKGMRYASVLSTLFPSQLRGKECAILYVGVLTCTGSCSSNMKLEIVLSETNGSNCRYCVSSEDHSSVFHKQASQSAAFQWCTESHETDRLSHPSLWILSQRKRTDLVASSKDSDLHSTLL